MRKLTLTLACFATFAVTGCSEFNPDSVASGYCDEGRCYQCDAEGGCWFVPNNPCGQDGSCYDGQVCTNLGCCYTCEADSECGEATRCVNNLCVPYGFEGATPISPNPNPNPNPQTQPCNSNAECGLTQVCDPETNTCVDPCVSDDACGPGLVCAACGKCQPPEQPATCGAPLDFCDGDADCGSGKACRSGLCHQTCSGTGASTCPLGQTCQNGACADDPEPTPECVLDIQCDNAACINGTCFPLCATSSECGNGLSCQMGVCRVDYSPAS